MVKIFKLENPFDPHHNLQYVERSDNGFTLDSIAGGYKDTAWICLAFVGGKRIFPLREEWEDVILNDGDCVYWIPAVNDFGVSLIFVAFLAVAATYYVLSFDPPRPGDIPEPDTVFNLQGQRNKNRLGHVIEDAYGKNKLWPSYAAAPYNQFIDNDQYQYQLFCLGHGSYDVTTETDADHGVFIEDTLASNFAEVETEIALPGELITLFPTNVESSDAVGTLELEEPDGWNGPFVVNGANTDANLLQVDVVFPKGLYYANDSGGLTAKTVTLEFEYQEIDDSGTPVGGWATLANVSKTLATNTPQRFTFEIAVTAARYQVRGRRTDTKDTSHRAGHDAIWAGLRAFLPNTTDFGDVTMLAVKAKATNNLNDRASNRVNVVATRMLPDWDGGTGTLAAVDSYADRTASRSPIWAMANILRASYGGDLDDAFLDLSFFGSEATVADTAGITFDHVFDQRGTVWEAIKTCLFVNKSQPIMDGTKITLVRDKPNTSPDFFLNPENTIKNSFKLTKQLSKLKENDGLDVEYLDETTWKLETVECRIGGEAGNYPKKLRLRGVTGRQNAYDLGMYLWYMEKNERDVVSIATGLEGYYPTFGDLTRIGSDVPKWGTNGFIKEINGQNLTLSEEVTFEEGETYKIALRGKHGQDLGPYTVTAGSAANIVTMSDSIPAGEFFFDCEREPPYFIFGKENIVGEVCRVREIRPQAKEEVQIVAVVDDQDRFQDFGTVSALVTGPSLKAPDKPVVTGLRVEEVPGDNRLVNVVWNPAPGATHYLIQTSPDGTDWATVAQTQDIFQVLPVQPGTFRVRVAGVNVYQGDWATWTGTVGENAPANQLRPIEINTTGTYSAATYNYFIFKTSGVTLTFSEETGNQVIDIVNRASGTCYIDADVLVDGILYTAPAGLDPNWGGTLRYNESTDQWEN